MTKKGEKAQISKIRNGKVTTDTEERRQYQKMPRDK